MQLSVARRADLQAKCAWRTIASSEPRTMKRSASISKNTACEILPSLGVRRNENLTESYRRGAIPVPFRKCGQMWPSRTEHTIPKMLTNVSFCTGRFNKTAAFPGSRCPTVSIATMPDPRSGPIDAADQPGLLELSRFRHPERSEGSQLRVDDVAFHSNASSLIQWRGRPAGGSRRDLFAVSSSERFCDSGSLLKTRRSR